MRRTDACIEPGGLGALLRREGGAESELAEVRKVIQSRPDDFGL